MLAVIKHLVRLLEKVAMFLVLRLKKNKIAWSSNIRTGIINGCSIGEHCYIGPGAVLNGARIGAYCSIAPHASIGGMEHSWWWGSTSTRISPCCVYNRLTTIGPDVWIGANAVVRQGIAIGQGAVIGAGAVVLHDVEPYTVVAGVPARVVRKRFPGEIIEQIIQTEYWSYPPGKAYALLKNINYGEERQMH